MVGQTTKPSITKRIEVTGLSVSIPYSGGCLCSAWCNMLAYSRGAWCMHGPERSRFVSLNIRALVLCNTVLAANCPYATCGQLCRPLSPTGYYGGGFTLYHCNFLRQSKNKNKLCTGNVFGSVRWPGCIDLKSIGYVWLKRTEKKNYARADGHFRGAQ